MSRGQPAQSHLWQALAEELGRELSFWTIMFHQAIAECVGLNVTDLKCLDALVRTGPMTAGQLAQLTGLTTGAITGVIDRLERADFVRRQSDPRDRRCVILQPLAERAERKIAPLFEGLARAMTVFSARYSEEELAVILDFTRASARILREETARLRAEARLAGKRRPAAGEPSG